MNTVERVYDLIEERGISLYQLARMSGVSYSTVKTTEKRGGQLTVDTFCNVEFEEGGRTYCYLADSDEYSVGDLVVVPAGRDNHEAVARIESIEYHPAEEAPFPIEKTKRIIRKHTT